MPTPIRESFNREQTEAIGKLLSKYGKYRAFASDSLKDVDDAMLHDLMQAGALRDATTGTRPMYSVQYSVADIFPEHMKNGPFGATVDSAEVMSGDEYISWGSGVPVYIPVEPAAGSEKLHYEMYSRESLRSAVPEMDKIWQKWVHDGVPSDTEAMEKVRRRTRRRNAYILATGLPVELHDPIAEAAHLTDLEKPVARLLKSAHHFRKKFTESPFKTLEEVRMGTPLLSPEHPWHEVHSRSIGSYEIDEARQVFMEMHYVQFRHDRALMEDLPFEQLGISPTRVGQYLESDSVWEWRQKHKTQAMDVAFGKLSGSEQQVIREWYVLNEARLESGREWWRPPSEAIAVSDSSSHPQAEIGVTEFSVADAEKKIADLRRERAAVVAGLRNEIAAVSGNRAMSPPPSTSASPANVSGVRHRSSSPGRR